MSTDESRRSDGEIRERMARVERTLKHQSELLERIENKIDDGQGDLDGRLGQLEDRNRRLWFTYQAGKWIIVVGSASTALAAAVSHYLV